MPLEVKVFRCLADNIGVIARDSATGACLAVDVPDADTVAAALKDAGWQLTDIIITHSHDDHVQGVAALKSRFGCRVVAPKKAAAAVPYADLYVAEGDVVSFGSHSFEVWETPGHCADHVSYILKQENIAFVGDVLFTLGCGRVFGDDYQGMWQSVERLNALPKATLLFGGHDYTLSNGRFALAVEPENATLKTRVAKAQEMAERGSFLVPALLADEQATNPFLRVREPVVARSVKKEGAAPFEVFKALREWKNSF